MTTVQPCSASYEGMGGEYQCSSPNLSVDGMSIDNCPVLHDDALPGICYNRRETPCPKSDSTCKTHMCNKPGAIDSICKHGHS